MHTNSRRGKPESALSQDINKIYFKPDPQTRSVPLASRGPPSGCCIQPCFPSEGSCIPARGSWWRSSSQWSWSPGCPPGCVDCTTLTGTYPPCPGSCGHGHGLLQTLCLVDSAPHELYQFQKQEWMEFGKRRTRTSRLERIPLPPLIIYSSICSFFMFADFP